MRTHRQMRWAAAGAALGMGLAVSMLGAPVAAAEEVPDLPGAISVALSRC